MGYKYTENEMIQAKISDTLSLLLWSKTKDAEYGRNKPYMILEHMVESSNPKQDFEHDVFNSVDEFMEARKRSLERN